MINTIMPNITTHTHCQVAQVKSSSQNLSKSMAAPTLTEKKMKKHRHTTMAIRNAGFGAKSILINFNKLMFWQKGLWGLIPHSA